ncbi:hypothetical protein EJV46_20050 [Roseococcus sp. SYP-B2431]|uniref:hypothetical protein n=1 Tax=Roseococcus sp. SYP-B2431 TaxID=2496640 RepID=UPI00103FB585|nr:hypothetical protein [Roseococcus sp. SYP-B2431]TCH96280.1 hypothetical protein EJV46_20050 [Roseococcus sp. SYP-B2431]
MTSNEQKALEELKAELQSDQHLPKTFEHLIAALIGDLLGISVAVAKSGFQHGADSGVGGRQSRSLRIECKRYADSTSLNERELLGEIDHALDRDAALEVWILATTREVPEQLEDALRSKAAREALPILVIDWKSPGLPLLAALCTSAPDTVEKLYSKTAADLTRSLTVACVAKLASLKADLQAWALGFEGIRRLAAERLQKMWNNPRTARAAMHQNVAGGAAFVVRREGVATELSGWWDQADRSLALIIGPEGVGKTWAALDWTIDRLDNLPIVLLLPASAAAAARNGSGHAAMRLLGEQLYEASGGIRDASHWETRARRLLKRPTNSGPVVLMVIDGLNQQPEAPWEGLFASLQDDPFLNHVRVIGTARPTYFKGHLKRLRVLVDRPVEVEVGPFNDVELDKRLAQAGMRREQLNAELLHLARTPRLFDLVARYHAAPDGGEMTLHRLLWEYGRDEEGKRQSRSFSEEEWRTWLAGIARHFRNGVTEMARGALADSLHRADLSTGDIKARLDDIVDGQLAEDGPLGRSRFKPEAVAHALGLALLELVQVTTPHGRGAVSEKLDEWLDPISGLDQRAEILRAAVSILVAQGAQAADLALSVLLTAWLTTQNLAEPHRSEITGMARPLHLALLDAVEQTTGYNQSGARLDALNALRAIPRDDGEVRNVILGRTAKWLSVISMDRKRLGVGSDDAMDAKRAARFQTRLGTSEEGEMVVLGHRVRLALDDDDEALQMSVASLLEGFSLATAISTFETAAIALAIRGHSSPWKGLKWLCLFNDRDADATATALRERALAVRNLPVETGIDARLPARVASLLLYLTGHETDENNAKEFDPDLDGWITYESDYLPHPAASFFPLEQRHAAAALCDTETPLLRRLERARDFLLDPNFALPPELIVEVVAAADQFDLSDVESHGSRTLSDHNFERLIPAVARCSPEALARLLHRKLRGPIAPESRYWRAIRAPSALLLTEPEDAQAAYDLRQAPDAHTEMASETWARTRLLLVELVGKPSAEQARQILAADLEYLSTELMCVLERMTIQEAEALLDRHGPDTTSDRAGVLMSLFFKASISESERLWNWLQAASDHADNPHRGLLFRLLTEKDSRRFGAHLNAVNWSWSVSEENAYVSEYGSRSLVDATSAMPFDQLLPKLAPCLLVWAARRRGADAAELRLAAEVLGRSILNVSVTPEIPGGLLTVDRTRNEQGGFSITLRNDESFSPSKRLSAEERRDADRRAVDVTIARVNEARAKGASLYLSQVDVADMKALVSQAPREIDAWLEGLENGSSAMRSRIVIAQGLYLALCEALLDLDPQRGKQLWLVLTQVAPIRYVGHGGVEETVHMLFRAPDSEPVTALRNELLALNRASTDSQLFDIAFAAIAADRRDWLDQAIEQDAVAPETWRQMRAVRLRGFTTGIGLNEPDAWPAGKIQTSAASLRHTTARSRARDAFAQYWWGKFLRAEDRGESYAAWTLFQAAADRRAYLWMTSDRAAMTNMLPLRRLKEVQLEVNRQELQRAVEKREEKLPNRFLDREPIDGVGPWGKTRPGLI